MAQRNRGSHGILIIHPDFVGTSPRSPPSESPQADPTIPEHLIGYMGRFMDAKTLVALATTCRYMREFDRKDVDRLWRQLCKAKWGVDPESVQGGLTAKAVYQHLSESWKHYLQSAGQQQRINYASRQLRLPPALARMLVVKYG